MTLAEAVTNRGNFIVILEHTAKNNPMLKEHLEHGKKNSQKSYLSETNSEPRNYVY